MFNFSKEKPDCSVVSFIDDCIRGDSRPCDIDKYVEYWHNNPQIPYTLREFLGFIEKEYEEYEKSNSVAFVKQVIQKRIDTALSRVQKDSSVEVIKIDF